jgi:membrane-associated protein
MEVLSRILDFILHIDSHLLQIVSDYRYWTYAILFLIIFCETGLVVAPFLPGDSLLFAAGALIAIPQTGLHIGVMLVLLIVAAIIGDSVNYSVGKAIGPRVFRKDYRFLKRAHLEQTRTFYHKYGGKTIIIARFLPIVRTFAPFVAGVGSMAYRRFMAFNVVGAVLWVAAFLLAGFFFGNIPAIKSNFSLVIVGISLVSMTPPVVEFVRHKLQKKRAPAAEATEESPVPEPFEIED